MVFSFNIPTLEHHCKCTYMHATPVLLSYSLDRKLLTLQKVKQCTYSLMSPFTLRYIQHTYVLMCIHVQCDLSRRSYTQTLQMNIFSPKMIFSWWGVGGGGGVQACCSPLPPPLSQIQLMQHTASACDNTHTVASPLSQDQKKPPKHPSKTLFKN